MRERAPIRRRARRGDRAGIQRPRVRLKCARDNARRAERNKNENRNVHTLATFRSGLLRSKKASGGGRREKISISGGAAAAAAGRPSVLIDPDGKRTEAEALLRARARGEEPHFRAARCTFSRAPLPSRDPASLPSSFPPF